MADLTKKDFLHKIAWEGGIDMALDYGLSPSDYDLPLDMENGWWELRNLYNALTDEAQDWLAKWDPEELVSG